jgi:hypothetical protein
MPTKLKKYYLKKMRERYQKSTKKQKTAILSGFCLDSGYSRKHGSRILSGCIEPRARRSGPKNKYGVSFVIHLKELWENMSRLCGKNMQAAIPIWLKSYPHKISDDTRAKLLTVSPSTIDRLLRPYKASKPRGLSATRSGKFKYSIPMRTLDSKAKCPGIVNSDTVAHCGPSLSGEFANTLTAVDLFSFWTENRAIWKKDAKSTLKQIKKVESILPFNIVEWFNDNGTEFINETVLNYFKKRKVPVNFKRTRAYKKNDGCYVEQKNYTHVRKIMGYKRIQQKELVGLMNEIYSVYWCPLQNFFTPSRKLIKKERINSKIKKTYDKPQTPYQRLINSGYLTSHQRRSLIKRFKNLDPFILKRELNKKLNILFQKVDECNRTIYNKVG